MLYNLQIQKLLIKAENVQSPYDRIRLLKKAINIADANNDIEWGFDLRKQIIETENDTSSCIEGLPAFTWLLDTYQQHPEICEESALMTEYKWMIQAVIRNAGVSLEQFNAITDDYKTRLLRNGYTLHSYYTAMAQMAMQRLCLDRAKEYLDLRESEKRDDLSECVSCEVHDLIEYKFLSDNIPEGVSMTLELLSGQNRCQHIPLRIVCITINMLDKSGLDDSADQIYKIAELYMDKMKTADMSNIGYIGKLVYFLTKRDKNMAWKLFERFLRWSINCEDYYCYLFSSGSLSLFKGSGTRRLNVSSAIPWHKSSGIYELPELYAYYGNLATTLAARFDARNGATNFSDELHTMD